MSDSGKIILCYWDFRGYGEPCRYMLEYCEANYEDKQIMRPSFSDHSPWRKIKENFGLDFPNLPYLIDGERRLTESVAILKYLGRKYGLVPKTEDDQIRADMLEGVCNDIRISFYDIFFRPKGYGDVFKNDIFVPKAKNIVKYFGDRKWSVSNELTYIDFLLYAQLSQTKALFPKTVKNFERLQKYMADFESLPQIDAYLKSDRFIEFPEHEPYIRKENQEEMD